jgi:hypothetical protein
VSVDQRGGGVEVPVDGRARDAEEVGDFLDGAFAGVVKLLGVGDLFGVEPGWTAAFASAGAGGGESVACVGDDQLALEFGEQGEHAEQRAAFSRRGVDALLDDVQADAALAHCARRVTRCSTEPPRRSRPAIFSVSPSRSALSSCGRLAFAPPVWWT